MNSEAQARPWWSKFFDQSDQTDPVIRAEELAREIVDGSQRPFFARLMEYLDKEAAKPVPISTDHMEMVSSAARANTFKEIRQHLTSELTRAEQILADQQMEE